MKALISFSSIAALGLILLASQATAAVSVAPGDLIMGFFQVNGTGTGAAGTTYIYNAGAGADFRESGAPAAIDNLNADLTTAFGAGWATDNSLRWGVVGIVGATDPLTNGDPARTSYYSMSINSLAGDSAGFNLSSSQRGSLSTSLKSFTNAANGLDENGAVDGGAFYSVSNPSSFSSFLPPTQTTSFAIGQNPLIALGSPLVGLDIYRTLHSTASADLTAAFADGNAQVGTGQYIGSFTLSPNGDVNFVPEPSTAAFAAAGALFAFRRRRSA